MTDEESVIFVFFSIFAIYDFQRNSYILHVKIKRTYQMQFNESQISRMIEKIRNTKSHEKFKLNKNDVTPIDVYIHRTPHSITMMDAEVNKPIFTVFGWYDNETCLHKFVEEIIDSIDKWDLITKQHFIEVARKRGYEQ